MSVTNVSTMSATTEPSTLQLRTEEEPPVQAGAKPFNFSLEKDSASVEEERQHRKETLAAAFRILAKHGLGMGVVGHLTVRDPGRPDCFWVNPFHVAFSCMRTGDLLLIDHNGEVIDGGASGRRYNQAAFAIHAMIHNKRPDVIAVCHSHSVYGSAFASLGRLPDFITQDSLVFYDDISLYPAFGGVILAEEESIKIAEYLGNRKAVILQNHGLLTVGGSVESATFWFLYLEKVCQMQLLVDATGQKPIPIGVEEAKFTAAQTGTEESGKFHFQPYLQDIDKETGRDYVA
ncbi:class II aldolase/adducin family protein [Cryptococcus neoformans Tu259-1]|uniref:Class II aldolase/adducin family protein n=1 Tax=Cryptococcus neoformans Tu259-1 TaxID=1230072 RepID=A0A854QEC5_CRYNE|nr:class II aldolase/adducin family protein [Cryptococcus neoformans var. grubii AD1-83a]OXG21963.1 class II aldolase/adducin family protein [Cryptococcus neoformans var. grubii Tu259-1]OXG60481.1 class II aldolase/adducin family protein [Cryptococcus neoformans var. grubii MW-RSA1955]OXG64280.1 class II aldolase/adducin family protein [Cryptococcus neoformans var. grubii c8]OXG65459.1 class II aldolase/adducin family protein [Cryptococcus neoformans var. grubii CHC193]OXH11574.1 class II aldo